MTSQINLPYGSLIPQEISISNIDIDALCHRYYTDGYLYLKPIATAQESEAFFLKLLNSFGNISVRDAQRRQPLTSSKTSGMHVDMDYPSVDLHSETSFSPSRPSIIGFFCHRNSSIDQGFTLLCDGQEVWKSLSLDLRKLFLKSPITYQLHIPISLRPNQRSTSWYIDSPGVSDVSIDHQSSSLNLLYECYGVSVDPYSSALSFCNHLLIELYTEPQINSRSLLDLPSSELEDIRHHCRLLSHSHSKALTWSPGSFILVNNYRHMHGRTFWDRSTNDRLISVHQRRFRTTDPKSRFLHS